jgi:hypothetical protein
MRCACSSSCRSCELRGSCRTSGIYRPHYSPTPVPLPRSHQSQHFPCGGCRQRLEASRRIAARCAGGQGETVGGIRGVWESSTERVAGHAEGKARAAHAQEQVNAASDSVSKCQRRRQRTKRRGASSCSVKHLSESKCPAASASSSALRPQSQKVVPTSVAEARTLPDSARWQEAIESEVGSMVKYGVWEHADLPPGKQALPSFFIFDLKRDGRCKARLVAGGHRQREGLDSEEMFAPVCAERSVRMLLAVAAHEGLEIRQFDVCTAFLNGDLEEQEVYMRPPGGMEALGGPGKVVRLRKALICARGSSRSARKCTSRKKLSKHPFHNFGLN